MIIGIGELGTFFLKTKATCFDGVPTPMERKKFFCLVNWGSNVNQTEFKIKCKPM
jgi:hypothetical protein